MPKTRDPLQFAYVRITMQGEQYALPPTYKVFYVDDHKIRVRAVKFVDGKETEGPNKWIPWMAIDSLEEIDNGSN